MRRLLAEWMIETEDSEPVELPLNDRQVLKVSPDRSQWMPFGF